MKKLVFLLMLFASHSVWAGWTPMSKGLGDSSFYYHPDSIKIHGNSVKVWEYYDYPKPQRHGVLSERVLTEYNCQNKDMRLVHIATFDGHNLTGKTLYSRHAKVSKWYRVTPFSNNEKVLDIVCRR